MTLAGGDASILASIYQDDQTDLTTHRAALKSPLASSKGSIMLKTTVRLLSAVAFSCISCVLAAAADASTEGALARCDIRQLRDFVTDPPVVVPGRSSTFVGGGPRQDVNIPPCGTGLRLGTSLGFSPPARSAMAACLDGLARCALMATAQRPRWTLPIRFPAVHSTHSWDFGTIP
jgi:hypothetical protein